MKMDTQGQYDEFDLRNYINVIVKRRKLISMIFFCAVIGTAIVDLFMPKVYDATALILIVPSKIEPSFETSNLFINAVKADLSASQKPRLSLETHKVLLGSSAVLGRVINKLNLVDSHNKPLLVDDLLRKISLTQEEQTNVFRLSVRDKDPSLAMSVANVWAQEYVQYSQELISGEIKGVGDFVEDQFATAKKNFVEAEQKIAAFKEGYKIDLAEAELTMKKGKLNSLKADLLNTQVNIKIREDLLKELKVQIVNQGQFIVTSKAITDDALWQQSAQDKGLSDLDKMKLKSESVNPIYQDLKKRSIDTEIGLDTDHSKIIYLQEDISLMENDINDSEKIFDQKQIDFDQLNMELAACKQTYDNLSVKIEEARMGKAAELGEVKFVSTAYQPQHPVTSNNKKNIMQTGIIGLMVGLFMALFSEWYWKKNA
jgi:succinoglycan biosynthesis transport protein ExoP